MNCLFTKLIAAILLAAFAISPSFADPTKPDKGAKKKPKTKYAQPYSSSSMETPFYVGAAIGTTMFTGLSSNSWANNNSVTSTSHGVIFGYKLSNVLAIEGEYVSLGNPTIVSYSDSNGSFTVVDQFSSYGIGAVAMYPIADPYSVFIKLGFVNTSVTPVCSGAGFYSSPIFNTVFGCNAIVGSIGMGYGAGIQYNVNTSIGIRAGYQTYGTGISNISLTGIIGF